MNLKQSASQYRNIKGVRFECWTANTGEFEQVKKEAKALGLKTRTIEEQLYREVK